MMGWFSSAGSIARMICPPVAAYVFQFLGPNILFLSVSILVAFATLVMLTQLKLITQKKPRKKHCKTTHIINIIITLE